MKLQTGATSVAQRTATLLQTRNAVAPIYEPLWYRVVLANPPTHAVLPKVRQLERAERMRARPEKTEQGFFSTRTRRTCKADARHLFRLTTLRYTEDKIREMFYTNHPWELARPRNVIEKPGQTPISQLDWSSIVQPSLQLSGENVVHRTLWLAAQPDYVQAHGKDWFVAYEQARREFYVLRMREFVERQVAEEEATMYGSVFGPSSWDTTVKREQEFIEQFIPDAEEASKTLQAKRTKVVSEE